MATLNAWGPANDVMAGVPLAVVIDPDKNDRWKVLHRRVGDALLTLSISDGVLVDNETGTSWDPGTGVAFDGLLKGEILVLTTWPRRSNSPKGCGPAREEADRDQGGPSDPRKNWPCVITSSPDPSPDDDDPQGADDCCADANCVANHCSTSNWDEQITVMAIQSRMPLAG